MRGKYDIIIIMGRQVVGEGRVVGGGGGVGGVMWIDTLS